MIEEIRRSRLGAGCALALTTTTLALGACNSSREDMDAGVFAGGEGSSDQEEDTGAPTGPFSTSVESMGATSTPDAELTTGGHGVCGNGVVEDGEACDDEFNDGSYGGCSVDCQSLAPHCGDGNVDALESCDDANWDSTDGCLSNCSVPANCMEILLHDLTVTSGIHEIDSDGPGGYGAYEAYCDMDHAGGGWTLVIVSAEDGHATWTWLGRELMTTDTFLVGNVAVLDEDFKSPALHLLAFSDLLFVHEPSGLWASYADVGNGTVDVGTFMDTLPFPQCGLSSGFPMADGDLTTIGTNLCDTDLYFHLGDHDGAGQAYCEAFVGVNCWATYGPAWNAANNGGCSMDDPNLAAMGPAVAGSYDETHPPQGVEDVEFDSRGFATPMGVAQPSDRLEMYVR